MYMLVMHAIGGDAIYRLEKTAVAVMMTLTVMAFITMI